MSKKLKLSPWHDGMVNPVHIGVYEKNWKKIDRFYCFKYYSFWNGNIWTESRMTIAGAFSEESKSLRSAHQDDIEWRGVLK